jgi:hypothetical protein
MRPTAPAKLKSLASNKFCDSDGGNVDVSIVIVCLVNRRIETGFAGWRRHRLALDLWRRRDPAKIAKQSDRVCYPANTPIHAGQAASKSGHAACDRLRPCGFRVNRVQSN